MACSRVIWLFLSVPREIVKSYHWLIRCKRLYQYILNLIRSCWFAIVHVLLMVQIAQSLLLCVWWLSHVGHLWSRQIWTVTSASHIRHPGERKTHKTLKDYVAIHLTLQWRIENKQKRVNHNVLLCRLLHNI